LIFETSSKACDEMPGIKLPRMASRIDDSNAITIMPIVGGHFIRRSFTYAKTAVKNIRIDII
jgi:hypothetical protein